VAPPVAWHRWAATDWWEKLAAAAPDRVASWDVAEMARYSAAVAELVCGDRVLHTDLHAEQFRVGPVGGAHVIDWGFPGCGAAWVDA
jgi:hypothetical protein